jgi:deazaflavin-dependent oxidoreductase (nitroreductase family)
MPEKVREVKPPTGLTRLVFRIPIWFYRAGLGGLLGDRFLELTHTGRKSGLARQAVLEVVRHDKKTGIYYIAAGFGGGSDWYRNILANPHVEIRSGRVHVQAVAVPLSEEEAGDELVNYARRHPKAFKELARFMGYRVDGSEADIHALGRYLRMFALTTIP